MHDIETNGIATRTFTAGSARMALVAGAVYLVAAMAGIAIAGTPGGVASIWIANALALTVLLRQDRSAWLLSVPTVFVAGFLVNVAMGDSVAAAVGLMAGNIVEILLAALVIRLWYGPDFRLGTDLGAYFRIEAVAAVAAPLVGAAIGATVVNALSGADFGTAAWSWWSGSAMGAIVILPLTLSATPEMMRQAFTGRNALEFAGIGFAAAIITYLAVSQLSHPFMVVGLALAVAAMRLNPFATATVSTVAIVAIGVAGLAGDIRSLPAGSSFLDSSFHVYAAFSIILAFAVSLLIGELRGDRSRIAESEERFRSAMDNSAIGMALVGLDGRWILVNPATCELLGYSADELMDLTFQDLTHPDDLSIDTGLVQKAIAGEIDSYRMEKRYYKKDGSIVWALLVVAIIRDQETRAPLYFVSQIEDITDRKRAEEKLAESEQRWAFALEGGRQGVWDHDAAANKTFYSPTWCEMFGHAAEDLADDPRIWQTMVHPDDLPAVLKAERDHSAGLTPWFEIEMRMRHRDGSWIWVLDRAQVLVRDDDGRPLRTIGTFTDITRLKEAEAALAAIESRWNFALEGARQGVWDFDLRAGKTYYSPVWKSLLGYEDDELGDDPSLWLDFVHPDDRELALAAEKDHLANRTGSFECEFRMRHKDGRWVWVLDRGKVIERAADGAPLRMIGTQTDITAQKLAEEKVRLLSDRMSRATKAGKVGLWELDPTSGAVWWDEGNHKVHGTDPATFRPEDFESLVHPADLAMVRSNLEKLISGEDIENRGYRIITPAGELRHIRTTREFLRDEDGSVRRLAGANWDVTQETLLTVALSEEKERLRVTLESIGDAVICTDRGQSVTFMNPVAASLTGWSPAEAIYRPVDQVFRIVDEETGEPLAGPVGRCLESLAPVSVAEGCQLVDRTGARIDIRTTVAPVKTDDADVLGTVVVFQDITRERSLQRQIAHSATHDSLTSLRNRASFEHELTSACHEANVDGRTHALCFLDLDRFKAVNDAAGHAAGDDLLKDLGALVKASVRGHDITARLGGDEFGLLLRDCPATQAMAIADKLIETISAATFEWEAHSFRVGASIGVCEIVGGATPSVVLKEADMACYAAKAAGRNQARLHRDPGDPAPVARAS